MSETRRLDVLLLGIEVDMAHLRRMSNIVRLVNVWCHEARLLVRPSHSMKEGSKAGRANVRFKGDDVVLRKRHLPVFVTTSIQATIIIRIRSVITCESEAHHL